MLVMYPGTADTMYGELARRLVEALHDVSLDAKLYSAGEVCEMAPEEVANVGLLVVDPAGCVIACRKSRRESNLLAGLAAAKKRIAVIAEPATGESYGEHFALAATFDAVLDLGFVSQKGKHATLNLPYHFVPDGPTNREGRIMETLSPLERPIPWTLVGCNDPGHTTLVNELIDEVAPDGLALLTATQLPAGDERGLAFRDLAKVLARSSYFVWASLDPSGYFESHCYLKALLCGAVPCKIDTSPASGSLGVPGVFPSARALRAAIDNGGFESAYDSARRFYLERDPLGLSLKKALQRV